MFVIRHVVKGSPMRTKKFLVAGAAALALTLSACAPNAAAPAPAPGTAGSTGAAAPANTTPVKVDIIYSKTGPLAAYGETFYQGFQAGLDYATKGTGEVNGRKLDITYTDDAGNADKAVAAAKDSIGNGTKIMGGTVVSGVALKLAEQAAQNKVLYISGPATQPRRRRPLRREPVPHPVHVLRALQPADQLRTTVAEHVVID